MASQGSLQETISGALEKKRPNNFMGSLSQTSGFKTRHCTLVGTLFSWADTKTMETIGYCDVQGAVCDGKAMHAGGSDHEAPVAHLIFKLTPTKDNGKPMELKAPTVSDARLWIKALQNASKGIVPTPTSKPAAAASTPAPPPMMSQAAPPAPVAAAAAAPAPVAAPQPVPQPAAPQPISTPAAPEPAAAAAAPAAAAPAAAAAPVAAEVPAAADGMQPGQPPPPPGPPPAPAPPASNWAKVMTPEGQPYFYDDVSGTTSWDPPPGWVEP